ncbi:MAG: nitrous oxide reductase accessory protein NosL [Altibacter sp.]|uniref:nitrous oxide reductase accessory protein NosL n=1 Tax=Altibacter sp. TaxID=2024823 RepID=UPI001D93499A|nr:nitrous oxide reductase accessory protein NosL [Altibacter sp.]MBZ0328007.1 nitrous oxide reductase accessory protein NosL [Altibacter sp.]
MKNLITLVALLVIVASCNVKPKEINYGEDACHYCSMTIVDRQHASQLVTDKGKVYNFDAIECMVNHLSEDTTPIALYLVTDYTHPEELIDAKKATFIISPNIPSPMKANLSALESKAKAEELKASKGGELYSWEALLDHLNEE